MTTPPTDDDIPRVRAIVILLGVTLVAAGILIGSVWLVVPPSSGSPPQSEFTWTLEGNTLTATHTGSDRIAANQLTVHGTGIANSGQSLAESGQYDPDATLTQGDQITIGTGYYTWTTDHPSGQIRLIWTAPNQQSTYTLSKWANKTST